MAFLDFQLLFALASMTGGTGSWTVPFDTTIVTIEADAPVLFSLEPTSVYPSGSPAQAGLLFVCVTAGRFDAAIQLKLGQTIYFVRSGIGNYKVAFGYFPEQAPVQG